ncbi:hypothetical protein CTM_22521 [Clostridium tetanomorphum DSM 665]|nr:hypothetical protein CTM_22521 [Clostridium tetanomorphum DSM 665]
MIQQHYYTRDKRGVYSGTPGYDTVAKSINLEDDFILNIIHNLCFYDPPAILAGEEDITKYPKSLFCINTEDNRMIIGQSVFAGKDYTKGRNRYFTHNYIIPKDKRENYIEEPDKIIYLNDFVDNYDIAKGNIIPEILETMYDSNIKDKLSIDEMFNKTGMDKEAFKKLILASINAGLYKKKIYIILNCELINLNNLSKQVLTYLYRCIPFQIRREIGFSTYMKEPKNKDFINIIFLPKDSIKRLTTEIKAGYVLLLSFKNFYLENLYIKEHLFIDFVINNINNLNILKEFFEKIDKIQVKHKLNIEEYDNITHFIQHNSDNFTIENIRQKYEKFLNDNNKQSNLNKRLCENEKDIFFKENIETKRKENCSCFDKFIKKIKEFIHSED